MRTVVILILLIGCTATAFAQPWNFSLEGGLNSSGIPHHDGSDKIRPHLSPLMGVHFSNASNAGLYWDLGFRYTLVGNTTTSRTEFYDQSGFIAAVDSKERFLFQKLSFGIGAGYQFQLWQKTFNAGAGYRFLYFGRAVYDVEARVDDASGTRLEYIDNYNPMNNPSLVEQAKRTGHEIFLALGMNISRKVRAELQYSFPTQIRFIENQSGQNITHTYTANDVSLTCFFRLGE